MISFGSLVRNVVRNRAGYVLQTIQTMALVKYANGEFEMVEMKDLELMPTND